MVKVVWEDAVVFYLIDKVHHCDNIWNQKNQFYKNKLKKHQFWLQMADEINEKFKPTVQFTYWDVLRKWNNLKTYFTSETQKFIMAEKSGATAADLEKLMSNWKFKSRLHFLTASATMFINTLNKKNNLEQLNSTEPPTDLSERSSTPTSPSSQHSGGDFFHIFPKLERDESLDDVVSPPPEQPRHCSVVAPPPPNKRPKMAESVSGEEQASNLSEPQSNATPAISESSNRITPAKSNNAAFGVYISAEIDKLDSDLQVNAKRKIFGIVMDLQLEQNERHQI